MADKAYLAVDMGASSGRHVVGRFDGQTLQLEELYRFDNGPVDVAGSLHWDLLGQWSHVMAGLRAAGARYGGQISGIGVDTWGVDFGLLGKDDVLLGNPSHYRDSRTNGMLEKAFSIVPREEIFRHSGLQFMQLNTLYQLLAMKLAKSPLLDMAQTMLLMPDLFHWLLTGQKYNEFTDATTTQFYNPVQGGWATELLEKFDLPTGILGPIAQPGTNLGVLRPHIAADTGLSRANVILPGTHDTASAVMAVPAASRPGARPDWCYISLGTWALMGVESPEPVVNDQVLRLNFTNEGGVGNTIRLLKNITGLWLIQECRRVWNQAGRNWQWEDLNRLSAAAPALRSFINPDAHDFLAPKDMPEAIRHFTQQTGQPVPENEGRGAALRSGQPRPEVSPGAGDVRIAGRRPDRDDPHRRRRDEEPPALSGRGRRLWPSRGGRSGRGHRHRQRDDAGRCRWRRRQHRRSPRRDPPQFCRGRVRAAQHGCLGRGV